jgi:hypothetical protein
MDVLNTKNLRATVPQTAPGLYLRCVGAQQPGRCVYCSPVLRHPAKLIQAANFRSAIAF